jgi:hypothetical protein
MLIANKFNGYSRDGLRLYNCDDGGQQQPTSTSTSTLSYPKEFQPMVDSMAKRAMAAGAQEYQTYPGQRIQGFDPLQQASQTAVANLGPAQQLAPATQFAAQAGTTAGQFNYMPQQFQTQAVGTGSFAQPGVAGLYMSPYVQNVVDIQNREAQRQADIAQQQMQAGAVKSGAFGGSRQAILQAEAARNLAQQKGDIQQKGMQAAYEQAQNLYGTDAARALQAQQANQQATLEAQRLAEQSRQYGAGMGMQGLQTQLQAAQQLGSLGQQQFGMQKDIINAMSMAGAQRQALDQQIKSQDYQDFLNQRQYPYQQVAFLNEMLKGIPQQTTKAMYEAPASLASQLVGLGGAAMTSGLFKKEGGSVHSYKNGGLVSLAVQNLARG